MATPAKATPKTPEEKAEAAKAATTKRALKRSPAKKPPGLPEVHTESEAIAFRIAEQFGDLKPSVARIMEAQLGEPGQLKAITLFRDSLGVPGDPYRNPANAIEAGRLVVEEPAGAVPAAE